MTDADIIDRISFQDRRERRDEEAKWGALVEQIVADENALEHFRALMLNYVGAPDQGARQQEGLPPVHTMRYGDKIAYPTEVCAVISDRGEVTYIRAIEDSQQWNEDVDSSYSLERILERGKNYFVVEGSLLSTDGLKPKAVARHSSFATEDGSRQYHRLQVLPENAFSQPYIPVYGDVTFLPWQMYVESGVGGAQLRYAGDYSGRLYRPIDSDFVDLLADANHQRASALNAIAS